MSNLAEQIPQERNNVFNWFDTYKVAIQRCLKIVYDTKNNPNAPFEFYNLNERALSEMPLCEVMQTLILPEGFRNIGGKFRCKIGNFEYDGPHNYAISPHTDQILCVTFGQFFLHTIPTQPFERIEMIQQQIPESVVADKVLGVAALIISQQTFAEKFEVHYE